MSKPKTVRDTNADIAAIRKLAERVLFTLGDRSRTLRKLAVGTLMLCAEVEEWRAKAI